MSLDPKEARQEREDKKRKENIPPPLNPPFPYRPTAFDPDNFPRILDEPPIDKDAKP